MPINSHDDQDPTLPPPGSRWGAGAQSVLPYLTKSLQARPASATEQAREPKAGVDERQAGRPSPTAA
jgi:hypothetical protein